MEAEKIKWEMDIEKGGIILDWDWFLGEIKVKGQSGQVYLITPYVVYGEDISFEIEPVEE